MYNLMLVLKTNVEFHKKTLQVDTDEKLIFSGLPDGQVLQDFLSDPR